MIDFIEYVVSELKSKRLSRHNALALMQQFAAKKGDSGTTIHPLLHTNISDLSQQTYQSVFSGQEPFLADHQVKTSTETWSAVLPGAAYLEMVQMAVRDALPDLNASELVKLQNVVWAKPVVVTQATEVFLTLIPEDAEQCRCLDFEIYSISEQSEETIHCQGQAILISADSVPSAPLESIKAQLQPQKVTADTVYHLFSQLGLRYGGAHQAIESLQQGAGQVLAHLQLPESLVSGFDKFLLHPSLLDGALQASVGLQGDLVPENSKPSLPFALGELVVYGVCPANCYAWVRYAEGSSDDDTLVKLDIDLVDEHGQVCVALREFAARVLSETTAAASSSSKPELLLALPTWKPLTADNNTRDLDQEWQLVSLQKDSTPAMSESAKLISITGAEPFSASEYENNVQAVFQHCKNLLAESSADGIKLQLLLPEKLQDTGLTALNGLLQSVVAESPQSVLQLLLVADDCSSEKRKAALAQLQQQAQSGLFRISEKQIAQQSWQAQSHTDVSGSPYKDNGVYLITGASGALGQLFLKEILNQTQFAKVVALGRSETANFKPDSVDSEHYKRVFYYQADLNDKAGLQDLIKGVSSRHGALTGVLHIAGMTDDSFLRNKTAEQVTAVLSPKVAGTINLDLATRHEPLDFFVMFSSMVAVTGNTGQADYAAANGFMDQFAAYREQLNVAHQRQGKSLSVNWPYWQTGGMMVDTATQAALTAATGLVPLPEEIGVQALGACLAKEGSQQLVAWGDTKRVLALLNREAFASNNAVAIDVPAPVKTSEPEPTKTAQLKADVTSVAENDSEEAFKTKTQNFLREQLSSLLKIPAHRIEVNAALENYGIDSILAMNLTRLLEETFGSLSKTLFFEYQTIAELSQYFIKKHNTVLQGLFGQQSPTEDPKNTVHTEKPAKTLQLDAGNSAAKTKAMLGKRSSIKRRAAATQTSGAGRKIAAEPIAIVGISGRYPESPDLDTFWQNLRNGKDCVVEVPESRWDWHQFYTDDRTKEGGHYSKWGGFIEGVDEFDPRFFNISPRDAVFMDPQERLFLQQSWHAMEDAGLTRDSLRVLQEGDSAGQVGVYAGVMYGEYNRSGSLATIANRVSYCLDLHGPSMTLDSMCSSSLTAIHLACEDLKHGRTDAALAGGVNVSIHPGKYTMLSAGQFISDDGHCQSFGEGGDGYIPGEGAGVVVLKRLSDAVRDGHHIYAVISGSALNHGGKTNGYTVPNPHAQTSVIRRALNQAGRKAEAVSYIEAHGTGTKLGDPIEITALNNAFQELSNSAELSPGSCAIGSAKSNIGHCESAAGIAGLTKVVLQLQHKEIVPSLHSSVLNPHINFAETPFEVNQELRPWPAKSGMPRIAGISSFGAGGSNAHLVIEEYLANASHPVVNLSHVVVPLSARTGPQLEQKVTELLAFLENSDEGAVSLASLAYTLQIGREPMDERVAFWVQDIAELHKALAAFVDSPKAQNWEYRIFRDNIKGHKDTIGMLRDDRDFLAAVSNWLQQGKLEKVLDFWVKGLEPDWLQLYSEEQLAQLQRISLPGYPFARETYWMDLANSGPLAVKTINDTTAPAVSSEEQLNVEKSRAVQQHPLLHENFSSLGRQRYRSEFSADHTLMAGSRLAGAGQMAPTTLLAMALVAAEKATDDSMKSGQHCLQLQDMVFGLPFSTTPTVPLNLELAAIPGLSASNVFHLAFDIFSYAGKETIHAQGLFRTVAKDDASVDIRAVEQLNMRPLNLSVTGQSSWQNAALSDTCLQAQMAVQHNTLPKELLLQSAFELLASVIAPQQVLGLLQIAEACIYQPLSKVERVQWLADAGLFDKLLQSTEETVPDSAFELRLLDQTGQPCAVFSGVQFLSAQRGQRDTAVSETLATETATSVGTFQIAAGPVAAKPASIQLMGLKRVSDDAIPPRPVTTLSQSVNATETLRPTTFAGQTPAQSAHQNINQNAKRLVPDDILELEREELSTVSATAFETSGAVQTLSQVAQTLTETLAQSLFLEPSEIDPDTSFIDLGLDSIIGVEWVKDINKVFATEISATRVYDFSTINALSVYVHEQLPESVAAQAESVTLLEQEPEQDVPVLTQPAVSIDLPEDDPNKAEVASGSPIIQRSGNRGFLPHEVEAKLADSLAQALYLEVSEIENDASFIDLGLDSIVGVEWVNSINKLFDLNISATRVYDYANLSALSQYIVSELEKLGPVASAANGAESVTVVKTEQSNPKMASLAQTLPIAQQSVGQTDTTGHSIAASSIGQAQVDYPQIVRRLTLGEQPGAVFSQAANNQTNVKENQEKDLIAVVGMSGRYPDAPDLDSYWNNIVKGKNSVIEIPESRWDVNRYYDPDPTKPGKVYAKWLGMLQDAEMFDPLFFQIPPSEARSMDPQHRLFLQEGYHAFEDAGYSAESLNESNCGVYVGIMSSEYAMLLAKDPSQSVDTTANSFAIGAARLSYHLNLKGPAIPVDTACSSSLVAMHLACQALQNNEIDMALAGGVSLYLTADSYLGMCQAGMLSAEGQCKAFDNSADGFVPGEGVGTVVLKRLADAERDGDNIYGVIRASGINQDGKTNGITAPSVNSQIALERELYNRHQIDPESISYVEAHGTGTKLGDPIELEALGTVYAEKTARKNFCALGSVKSNIGHTSGAAGVASVQKVLLSMQNQQICPTLHVKQENQFFDFTKSPFYINKQARPWSAPKTGNRRAAVSSFGFSGTNAHMVLEQYVPAVNHAEVSQPSVPVLIPLSARTEAQLQQVVEQLLAHLSSHSDISVHNLAFTLQVGRTALAERLILLVSSVSELQHKLRAWLAQEPIAELWRNKVTRDKQILAKFNQDPEFRANVHQWLAQADHHNLAQYWVQGLQLDWQQLKRGTTAKLQRVSLPGYPFAKQRFWVDLPDETRAATQSLVAPAIPTVAAEPPVTHIFAPHWQSKALLPSTTTSEDTVLLAIDTPQALANTLQAAKYVCSTELKNTEQAQVLVGELQEMQCKRLQVLLFSGSNSNDIDTAPVMPLFYLCQALQQLKFKGKVAIVAVNTQQSAVAASAWQAISGFGKSLSLENPAYSLKTLNAPEAALQLKQFASSVVAEFDASNWQHPDIRYDVTGTASDMSLQRSYQSFTSVARSESQALNQLPFKQGGTYLITGGLGGIGLLMARYLTERYQARLVLSGRSDMNASLLEKLQQLLPDQDKVLYVSADVTQAEQVQQLVSQAKQKFTKIDGVLHCAGFNKDAFILNKYDAQFEEVLAPKLKGTVNLDAALADEQLDLFLLFSSVAGSMGNPGQCDYAYANCFMDNFAKQRELQRVNGNRWGHSLSVNWPLWQEGGMNLSDSDIEVTRSRTGMLPLPTEDGLQSLEFLLSTEHNNAMVMFGETSKIQKYVVAQASSAQPLTEPKNTAAVKNQGLSQEAFLAATVDILSEIISSELQMSADDFDSQERFESYGIDSIVVGRLNLAMENVLGELPKTLFYEYETTEELAKHLTQIASAPLRALLAKFQTETEFVDIPQSEDASGASGVAGENAATNQVSITQPEVSQPTEQEGVAIVGIHGYFPQSASIDDYWHNLKSGKDLVQTVPDSRWDHEALFDADPERAKEGKIYCKWGSFLDNFDQFDADFFNIDKAEAAIMDPQERLFMQSVWSALEDAGYTRQKLQQAHGGDGFNKSSVKNAGSEVGVFVGVTSNTYHLLAPQEWAKGNSVTPSALPWSIANRVSYFFDFTGPSMPVDTACSSSLVAVHMACESLRSGECQLAVAGGVNLYLHPAKYHSMCTRGMLAQHGKNRSFGAGDNGFIPGEGVASLILKPVSKAIADGDHIYGVIAGSACSHSGRSNGYSAPNPHAQAAVISDALQKSGLTGADIGYVEGHGTGTQLGDNLEVVALKQAFGKNAEAQTCALGSVKANLGHTESAAGVAGIGKVLMQIQHKHIAPGLHTEPVNPDIDFNNSPFYLSESLHQWHSPKDVPRRALINAFGAGGVNAAMVIEEHLAEETQKQTYQQALLVPISARSEKQLRRYVQLLLTRIQGKGALALDSLAYTLQTGREAMPWRLAVVASSIADLREGLLQCLKKQDSDELFMACIPADKMRSKAYRQELQNDTDQALQNQELTELARLWLKGAEPDWNRLYAEPPVKISLPTYPFATERHWIEEQPATIARPLTPVGPAQLHPLLSYNASTLKMVSFISELDPQDFYAREHRVNGSKVFPGTGYLEIANVAGTIAGEQKVRRLSDLVWAIPYVFEHDLASQTQTPQLQTFLKTIGNATEFEVTSVDALCERQMHCEGRLFFSDSLEDTVAQNLDPKLMLQTMNQQGASSLSHEQLYQQFRQTGLHYGTSFRTIQQLYCLDNKVLTRWQLPASLVSEFADYLLHPAILDGALQSIVGITNSDSTDLPYLPFAIGQLDIMRPLSMSGYTFAEQVSEKRVSDIRKYNITVTDDVGQVLLSITDFCVRALPAPSSQRSQPNNLTD
ncbi:MAG: SDR family NAD(P)-dependent oxidoreductase [Aestuariibacter sp.]